MAGTAPSGLTSLITDPPKARALDGNTVALDEQLTKVADTDYPYRRKTISFEAKLDKALGAETVQVKNIGKDNSDLPLRYDPSNSAANAQGYVKLPNVNSFIEVMDMREAERSYSANLAAMQASRSMLTRTIDMLK
jgi:flagellar basal-body rod protein FlgC